MKNNEIISLIKESNHSKVKVAIVDIDGVLRGKLMHKDKLLSSLDSGFGFCDVVFGWDVADELYKHTKLTGWHTGFGDVQAQLDLSTFRLVPWEDDIPFILGDFSKKNGDDFPACPRSILKRVIKKAKNAGFSPVFSQEFEWFNYREGAEESPNIGHQNLQPLTQGMFGYSLLRASENSAYFNDLFELLQQFGVPLEGLHTETGPGVYEAAIQHTDILEAADRAVLFKTGAKEIAKKHGIIASFMAKQAESLPGCSGHIHQSLWDIGKKENLFYDGSDKDNMSNIFKSYLAGQLHCLPSILPMFAPTVNSYKRLVEGAWAPTTTTWGIDNRTTAIRALPLSPNAARIESRVVGADVNPYLAMAACLASGLYGIEKNLTLNLPKTVGNGYKDMGGGKLPANLLEATQKMKDSEIANELFGNDFVDHFSLSRMWEWDEFSKQVTDWETKRYFEII
ncbi:glutamine synthetase family protein [hydrothermal vent metagenome]|uniref:Glutamine synthetase family protein n=1 Tax=hydrothermal vent metagenome TaxID=652676 RepID=A0A3B0VH70_9ZZZZ